MAASATPLQKFPKLRARAAQLVLGVACLGTVATSQPRTNDAVTEFQGTPVQVTTGTRKTTRQLSVRALMSEDPKGTVGGEVRLEATARWRPTDPARPERPWLQGRIAEAAGGVGWPQQVVLEPGGGPAALTLVKGGLSDCRPRGGKLCEWSLTAEFELQPDVGEGTVDVEWKVTSMVHVEGTSDMPKGFRVEIFEP